MIKTFDKMFDTVFDISSEEYRRELFDEGLWTGVKTALWFYFHIAYVLYIRFPLWVLSKIVRGLKNVC